MTHYIFYSLSNKYSKIELHNISEIVVYYIDNYFLINFVEVINDIMINNADKFNELEHIADIFVNNTTGELIKTTHTLTKIIEAYLP